MQSKVVLVLIAFSCFVRISGETLSTHSPTFQFNIIQNFTSSYSAFLDDIYYYLGSAGNVSEKCRLQMNQIQHLAALEDVNALKIFDSTGKPDSGILEGGVYFIGFYSECVNTAINTKESILKGKYCLLDLNISGLHQEVLPDPSWQVLKKATKPATIGLCIPSACSNEDIKFATNASLYDNFEDVQGEIATCHANPDGFPRDIPAILFLCFQIALIFIMILATACDYYMHWRKIKACEIAATRSVSTELLCDQPSRANRQSSAWKYLFAFSMYTNAPKIFSVTSKENIACLHGLRFLSMALIIFGHSYSFAGTLLYLRNPGFASEAPKDFVTQIFANGTFAVDTFFFMSGLLVAYASIKTLRKVKNKWSWVGMFYLHRYLRLTPLMMGVVFNCAFLLRYISSGPNWLGSIAMFDDWCRKQWWVNALYIHNFYNTENMCLSHTWYLATDTQMYLVAPLILIPLIWNYKAGFVSMGVFLIATTFATGIITAENHYPAIPYINNVVPLDLVNEYYKNVYIKPYCRMGPFIVGIAMGYLLDKKKECTLKKYVVGFCWSLSVISGLLIIYLMWPANQGILPTNSEAAAYSALARTVWGVCLSWLVFACYYGYGGFINSILSWSLWVPFSRLTFPAYLIHPVIMAVVYGSTEGTREFAYSYMLYMFIGHICVTYILALFLSLLYESPIVVLEKILLPPPSKSKSSSQDEDIADAGKKSLEEMPRGQ